MFFFFLSYFQFSLVFEIIISFIATFTSVLVAEMVAVIIISDVVGVPGCARMFLLVHDLDRDLCIPGSTRRKP